MNLDFDSAVENANVMSDVVFKAVSDNCRMYEKHSASILGWQWLFAKKMELGL